MRQRPTNRGDGSLYFLLRRAHESSVNSRPGLYCINTSIEIDRRQESVDECAEASPFWAYAVFTLQGSAARKKSALVFGAAE